MDDLWSVKRFCRWCYECDEPTAGQVVSVQRMCRDGTLPAVKVGRAWRIDTTEIMKGVEDARERKGGAAQRLLRPRREP